MQYQLQVQDLSDETAWLPVIVGPDGKPRNFGTRQAALRAMRACLDVWSPFRFRVQFVEGETMARQVPDPTPSHMRVLRNIEAKRNETTGFVLEEHGVRAFFECVLYGWVCRGKITAEGRAVLAKQPS